MYIPGLLAKLYLYTTHILVIYLVYGFCLVYESHDNVMDITGYILKLVARALEDSSQLNKLTYLAWCKVVRPGHLVQPKTRLTVSGTLT
jgi:hypothetical protein